MDDEEAPQLLKAMHEHLDVRACVRAFMCFDMRMWNGPVDGPLFCARPYLSLTALHAPRKHTDMIGAECKQQIKTRRGPLGGSSSSSSRRGAGMRVL